MPLPAWIHFVRIARLTASGILTLTGHRLTQLLNYAENVRRVGGEYGLVSCVSASAEPVTFPSSQRLCLVFPRPLGPSDGGRPGGEPGCLPIWPDE